ncbi:murein L,D-transpeptidase family protein [Sulfuricella sp. T08]|uniref:L,D-transpeptidase family protein n=1 Tax=Sulfuricella sp. T08 TaxID=1632857 RepID=UPI001ED9BC10|nr:L,D-transpeptidase family protein [Sulfuricella sp. T08]
MARIILVVVIALASALGFFALTRDKHPGPRQKSEAPQRQSPSDLESMLVKSLLEVRQNRLDLAMNDIEALLKIYPNFKLAHLIRGDLLMARAYPLSSIGSAAGASQHQISDLREEARARLLRHLEQMPVNQVPKYLVQFQPEQHYAVVVDTGKSRLYLYQNDNGTPRYIADYYVSSGKAGSEKIKEGDQKTPLGVYFVTSHLPKTQISDFYGTSAFPISYPNEWDRQQGKNGHGIWLHGVPSDTYSRPPRASSGCVVLANPDLDKLGKDLQIGLTPVVISDHIEWADAKELAAQRDELGKLVENWRHDWESIDSDKYLRHYSKNFKAPGQNYSSWDTQKRQVNMGKTWVKIKLSGVSIFSYPGNENLMVITFDQDYSSNNLKNQMKKRQYWKLENNEWKIIYEGTA